MAIIFMDGLDCYADIGEASGGGWFSENAAAGFSTTAGRFGGGGLVFTGTTYQIGRSFPVITYGSTAIVGFSYYHAGASAPTFVIRFFSDTGTALASITHDTAGQVTFQPQAGSPTTSAGSPLTPNTWHWVEFKVVFGTTAANGSAEVKVDGVTVITAAAQDTNATGAGANMFEITGGGAANPNEAFFDDFVMMDGSGSAFNDFVGPCVITTQTPNADGGTVDWTASAGSDFQCVDEAPAAANDDTDYISSATAAQESRFALTDLAGTPSTVHAVQVRVKARKTTSGPRTIRGLINSNAVESVGTTVGLTTDYIWRTTGLYEQNPDGPAAWSESAVNALQAGVEIVS